MCCAFGTDLWRYKVFSNLNTTAEIPNLSGEGGEGEREGERESVCVCERERERERERRECGRAVSKAPPTWWGAPAGMKMASPTA